MERFLVKGRRPLAGEVEVRGSKNVGPTLMVASLLTEEPCFIKNVPMSVETEITREICENIGSAVTVRSGHLLEIQTKTVQNSIVPALSRRNRVPILALGPLLHRRGFAEVPVLGGCPIGHRPINFHVEALKKMGVKIERRENSYYAEAEAIQGADIKFPYPSVGATENVILTATLARGSTIIRNAAVEPEIMNLVGMLQVMGAQIVCDPTARLIKIEGVNELHGATVTTMPDRNEIISLAVAALATDGGVFIRGIEETYLKPFLEKVSEVGGSYEVVPEGIRFWGHRPYRATNIETFPHPGFMTDWQQPFCVLLTQAKGQSIIHETVYEDRFGYTKDLISMGARIEVDDECWGAGPCRFHGKKFSHSARISGLTKLQGRELAMTDIRAGMAHIIAALASEGEAVISGVEHIDRGYERIDERLRDLGADIKRI